MLTPASSPPETARTEISSALCAAHFCPPSPSWPAPVTSALPSRPRRQMRRIPASNEWLPVPKCTCGLIQRLSLNKKYSLMHPLRACNLPKAAGQICISWASQEALSTLFSGAKSEPSARSSRKRLRDLDTSWNWSTHPRQSEPCRLRPPIPYERRSIASQR